MKYTVEKNEIRIMTEGKYRNLPVSRFLDDYCLSSKNRYLFIQNRKILLNGTPVKSADEVIGDRDITILIEDEEIDWVQANQPCQVVYEDPFLYLVHKEPGVIIHGDVDDDACLNAQAAAYQAKHDIHRPVRPIHRLDQDTAGLVFYSKIPFFQPWFDKQLADKKIKRHYLAIVTGDIKVNDSFTCKDAIGRDRHVNGKYRVSPTGKQAETHLTCIARSGPYALISCELETGRTHQIRVHLSAHHLPIVNDPIYGKPSPDFRHMGLWADEITFRNPITKKRHKIHDTDNPDYAVFQR